MELIALSIAIAAFLFSGIAFYAAKNVLLHSEKMKRQIDKEIQKVFNDSMARLNKISRVIQEEIEDLNREAEDFDPDQHTGFGGKWSPF